MKNTELRDQRDEAVYDVYCQGLEFLEFENMREAADWVRSQPAPKFYISSRALANYLGRLFNGKPLNGVNDHTREKVMELYRRYCVYISEHPETLVSREKVCDILVDQPAPKFYIGRQYTLMIIQKMQQKKVDELRKRYVR